jgi:hypothetical protein
MKIKNNNEQPKLLSNNFTGILEYCDGSKHPFWLSIDYYKDSVRHRKDGPAIEYADGHKDYYLNGRYFSDENEWKMEVEKFRK